MTARTTESGNRPVKGGISLKLAIVPETRESLLAWTKGAEKRPEEPLLTSVANRNFGGPLTRVQHSNIKG